MSSSSPRPASKLWQKPPSKTPVKKEVPTPNRARASFFVAIMSNRQYKKQRDIGKMVLTTIVLFVCSLLVLFF